MKRSRIKSKPPRRGPMPRLVYDAVMERDQWCKAWEMGFALDTYCQGRLHVHHRHLRSQGGKDTEDNLLVICDLHHRLAHDVRRSEAERCLIILRSQ